MTRSLVGSAAAAMMMVALAPSMLVAQPATSPRVTVTRGDGRVTISAKTDALSVSQALTATAFDLTVSDGRDTARISGDVQGRVTVQRGGRSLALSMGTATAADAAAARAMLAGSPAVARFGQLVASGWGRSTKEALVFVSAHAMVSLLQGDAGPLKTVVDRVRTTDEPQLVRVRQMTASMCWRSYERDVLSYTYELEACITEASNSFNPLRSSWCAYSYNLKATLAFVWLLDCSGY